VLYGNGYYKQEFGKTSCDVFLPDCFGFGYALPSIASHCGLRSFSTQKLTWGSAIGIPFDIGLWEGVDGSTLVAGLNPSSYSGSITGDLSRDTTWSKRIEHQGETSGLYAAYKYFGTGDIGGSPDSQSVDWLQKSIHSDGPISVHSIGADDLANIVTAQPDAHLPRYKGELVMTRHGAGCYTSEAAMKRWNRKNELLADATERAAVIASTLGGYTYPREELKDTWIRFLYHQFHDDITGTSIPEAYEYSWNDEILCQNRFAGILENAVEAGTRALDTRAKGIPIVVYNPLAFERVELTQFSIALKDFPEWNNGALGLAISDGKVSMAAFGPDKKRIPAQILDDTGDSVTVGFLATVPSVGYAVYDLRIDKKQETPGLTATDSTLENQLVSVKLNQNGDVTSIFDKVAKRELLAAPIEFQLIYDKPRQWPAWEVQYEDIVQPPRAILGGPAEIKVIRKGSARAAIQVVRKSDKAEYRTVISLSDGSNLVRFDCDVDWREKETLLKAAFKFTTPNEKVTYDLGLGTIERGTNRKELYEVPGQQWADMTAESGYYGVSVLNDCKYGWDHPDTETLRLTLIHTPGVFDNWAWVGDQSSQDQGQHKFSFAVYGHYGDWRDGNLPLQAARFNQPLIAFTTGKHSGALGNSHSLLQVTATKDGKSAPAPNVMVNAVKLAENSDEIVIRLRELKGRPADSIQIRLARAIISTREIDGVEEPKGSVTVTNGTLMTSLTPYQPKAFAITLAPATGKTLAVPIAQTISIPYDLDGISSDDNRTNGNLDGLGNTLSGDLLPDTIIHLGIPFAIGSKATDAKNVLSCNGQSIALPAGQFNRLYVLAASVGGPSVGTFSVDTQSVTIGIQDYAEKIGQWNNRLVAGSLVTDPNDIALAYINRQPVAWYASHRHTAKGENDTYQFTYLYLVPFNLPQEARTLILPKSDRIKLFAATAVQTTYDDLRPLQPLYDEADAAVVNIHASRRTFIDSAIASLSSPSPGAEIRFTIDGTIPSSNSPVYNAPIAISASSTLKAISSVGNLQPSRVASLSFIKQVPRDPVVVKKTATGLRCEYFEGEWKKLPDFDSLKAVKDVVADTVAIPSYARKEDYGLRFTGYVNIPRDGMYQFILDSDDGSALYVCDSLLIDNDGVHGGGEVSGEIALKAGFQPIKVLMFQAKGGQGLALSLKGPEFEKMVIPASMFVREAKANSKANSRN
jgi:alpha-mannosidase